MPYAATAPAPASAPAMRAVSEVLRDKPRAPSNCAGGMVCAISELRSSRSEERTRPATPAITST